MARQGEPARAARSISIDLPFGVAETVRVHVFPSNAGLARDVREAWAEVMAADVPDDRVAIALQQRLRNWYPKLVVRTRHDVASFGPFDQLWYVYRDGLLGRRPEIVDRMYTALQEARRTEADSKAVVARATETMDRAVDAKATRDRGRPVRLDPTPDDDDVG